MLGTESAHLYLYLPRQNKLIYLGLLHSYTCRYEKKKVSRDIRYILWSKRSNWGHLAKCLKNHLMDAIFCTHTHFMNINNIGYVVMVISKIKVILREIV